MTVNSMSKVFACSPKNEFIKIVHQCAPVCINVHQCASMCTCNHIFINKQLAILMGLCLVKKIFILTASLMKTSSKHFHYLCLFVDTVKTRSACFDSQFSNHQRDWREMWTNILSNISIRHHKRHFISTHLESSHHNV